MLEIRNLSAGYGSHAVISHMNLDIPEGCFTAIIGPNGCGKSTLLKAIAGILPVSGSISFQGEDLTTLSPKQRAQKIAFLPQNRTVPELTAEKLVLHGRFPYLTYPRRYRNCDQAAAADAIRQLGIGHLSQRYLPTLSGGERQKVYLAMLLAQHTPVLLMDEPTSFLDISHKFEIAAIGSQLAKQGKTVVMVLHDLELALQYADNLVLLERGNIVDQGTAAHIVLGHHLEQVFQIQVESLHSDRGIQYCFLPKQITLQ